MRTREEQTASPTHAYGCSSCFSCQGMTSLGVRIGQLTQRKLAYKLDRCTRGHANTEREVLLTRVAHDVLHGRMHSCVALVGHASMHACKPCSAIVTNARNVQPYTRNAWHLLANGATGPRGLQVKHVHGTIRLRQTWGS